MAGLALGLAQVQYQAFFLQLNISYVGFSRGGGAISSFLTIFLRVAHGPGARMGVLPSRAPSSTLDPGASLLVLLVYLNLSVR